MKRKYLFSLIFIFVLFILFPLKINAALCSDYGLTYKNINYTTSGGYNELYDYESDERVYCLRRGVSLFTGGACYGQIKTISEGPACAFTVYTGTISSGSTTLHNIIDYVHNNVNSTSACESYKYVSGYCDGNNKNAAADINAKINLSKGNDNFTLSNGYYVNTVDVSLAGSVTSYSVSLTNALTGTIVTNNIDSTTDISGSNISDTKLYIKIPASSVTDNISLTLTATGAYTSTCNYAVPYFEVWTYWGESISATTYQPVGYIRWTNKSKSDNFTTTSSLSFDYETDPVEIKISKQDITTYEEIPGASMVLKDNQDNVLSEFVSTTSPKSFSLYPGTYKLIETVAPTGYKKIDTVIEFKINNDGTVELIDLSNESFYLDGKQIILYNDIENVNLKISKQDITSYKELEGSTMVLKDANGNIIEEFVSTSSPHEFSLYSGTYYLTETIAPEGYNKLDTTISFTVNRDRTIVLNSMESDYYELNEDVLVVFNSLTKIPVPDTGLNVNYLVISLAVISIGAGCYLLYRGFKNKKKI